MVSLLRRNQSTLGIDIGSSSIKAAVIDHSGARPVISRLIRILLPTNVVVDGEILEARCAAESLVTLFAQLRPRARTVVVSVGGRDLFVKRIQVDRMEAEYVREVIWWEAEQHVPFDVKNVQLDFQILDPGGDGLQMDVLLVAAKRETIEQRLAVIQAAGSAVSIVDVDALALHNAFAHNYPEAMEGSVALVNVGRAVSVLNLLQDGVPVLTREVAFGSLHVREVLEAQHGLTGDEAEAVTEGRSDRQLAFESELREAGTTLATGIQRAAAFHQGGTGERTLGRVYLCGGGARIPGLVTAVAERLGVRTEVANPLARLPLRPGGASDFAVETLAPMMMLAVGLALRTAR